MLKVFLILLNSLENQNYSWNSVKESSSIFDSMLKESRIHEQSPLVLNLCSNLSFFILIFSTMLQLFISCTTFHLSQSQSKKSVAVFCTLSHDFVQCLVVHLL